jgi:hypothetical protein
MAEHPANGFSASIDIAVWFNQADSRLKTFYWNVANKACSLGLERSDINLATHRRLPAADPAKAKVTFSVVDQKRPFGGRGTMNEAIGTLNRCLFRRWHRKTKPVVISWDLDLDLVAARRHVRRRS